VQRKKQRWLENLYFARNITPDLINHRANHRAESSCSRAAYACDGVATASELNSREIQREGGSRGAEVETGDDPWHLLVDDP